MDNETESNGCSDSDESDIEFKWKEALCALSQLSLTWTRLGDYVIIMNGKVDVFICGEPHMALQLWFNKKSHKFLGRVWNQTVATGRISNVAQFVETCMTQLKGRPCIGYALGTSECRLQGFVICPAPTPRKVSPVCQKVLDSDASNSCQECLKLTKPLDKLLVESSSSVKEESKLEAPEDTLPIAKEDDSSDRKQDIHPLEGDSCSKTESINGTGTQLNDILKKVHECWECGGKFTTKTYLTQHVKALHDKIKEHECGECGKGFSHRSKLKAHQKIGHDKIRVAIQ